MNITLWVVLDRKSNFMMNSFLCYVWLGEKKVRKERKVLHLNRSGQRNLDDDETQGDWKH